MGMGYAGCHAYIIDDDDLRTLVQDEYDAFIESIKSLDLTEVLDIQEFEVATLDHLAEAINQNSYDMPEEVLAAYDKLLAAFEKATKVQVPNFAAGSHLEIFLGYKSDGDIYDDIPDGHYWQVFGVTQPTEAGRKFAAIVQEMAWVHLG